MNSSNLVKHNLNFIQCSKMQLLIGLVSFIINVFFYPLDIIAASIGGVLGLIWGFLLPKIWKMDSSVLNLVVTSIMVIPLYILFSQKSGVFSGFQMLSVLLFLSGLIWYYQKDKLIKYLTA